MNKEMIKIYAGEEEKEKISKLLSALYPETDEDFCNTVVLDEGVSDADVSPQSFLVVSADDAKNYQPLRTLTYSMGGLSGDVSLLNVQERTQHISFEILYKDFMGRVFLPYKSEFTKKQILIAVATMFLLGKDAKETLQSVNEIIKEGE